MTSIDIKRELFKQITQMPTHLQFQLLDYAKKLAGFKLQGISGRDLLLFSGVISTQDARRISKVIEEGCEQVNVDEW